MDANTVDRLAALPSMAGIPREELEWIVERSRPMLWPKGARVVTGGQPMDDLYVSLCGHMVFYVDRGGLKRKVQEWKAGDLGGVLPYSRLKTSPGDAIIEEEVEGLALAREHHPELIVRCPAFTTRAVHVMIDRARNFTTQDLHGEKMASLGKLAAGMAHELNNPASAAARSAALMTAMLDESEASAESLVTLDVRQRAALAKARAMALGEDRKPGARQSRPVRTPLEEADREDEFTDWLEKHGVSTDLAGDLARTSLSCGALGALAEEIQGAQLGVALRWLAANCAVRRLAEDMERAASRIHDLVSAVKRFTYMDRATTPTAVEVGQGIRDSVSMLAAKARGKSVTVDLDIPDDLPPVIALGGELNQVWVNLLDNAIDAAAKRVQISATSTDSKVTVRVVDDGPGIPADVMGKIFDPFFTTKPIGQGTGLGLDIVRKIVSGQQGDISVESNPGRTEFCVTIPRASSDQHQQPTR